MVVIWPDTEMENMQLTKRECCYSLLFYVLVFSIHTLQN